MFKRVAVLGLLVLVAVGLTACRGFSGHETVNLKPNDNQATVYVYLADPTTRETALPELKQKILELAAAQHTADETAPYVQAAEWDESQTGQIGELTVYALKLTIGNYPDQVVTLDTDVWTIWRTYTLFNPVSLLPDDQPCGYFLGLTSERRHSKVNTESDLMQANDDGTYTYLWSSTDPLIIKDKFPNRTLYYLIAVAGAVGVGAVVFISCKKRPQQL